MPGLNSTLSFKRSFHAIKIFFEKLPKGKKLKNL
jgi:hypothetical protein